MKIIKWTMPLLGIIPIKIMLKVFLFSKDFGDKMVFPLIALFLGTGNQTVNVPSAIVERLFNDPHMSLWDYDSETLLPNLPTMVTFPKLHTFYDQWRQDLESKGVDIRLNTDVVRIISRDKSGVVVQTRPFDSQARGNDPPAYQGCHSSTETQTETFSDLVMCVLADDALRILKGASTWRERLILGGAAFFDDITITHSDHEYFQKHYETHFDNSLCTEPKSQNQRDQIAFSKGDQRGPNDEPPGFRPMYYTKSYAADPQKIEMSFDVTNYQHQFREDQDAEVSPVTYDNHVFQSIFLDSRNQEMWTKDEIAEDKVIESKWWHQLGHRWQHYVRVVPGMMWINGKNNTLFAGSWTLVVSSLLIENDIWVDNLHYIEHARISMRQRHCSSVQARRRLCQIR